MTAPRVHLVWLGGGAPPAWREGETCRVEPGVEALASEMRRLADEVRAGAVLFWGPGLPAPDPGRVLRALDLPGDVWHAGLRLGLAGLPGAIDFVVPTWMLNRDPDPRIVASSWRLSLSAALVRAEVLRSLGGIRADFRTLAAAGLELGHRYVMRGALVRQVPWLLPEDAGGEPPGIPFEDELRFVHYRFGRFWTRWCAWRAARTGYARAGEALAMWRRVSRAPRPADPPPLHAEPLNPAAARPADVTVLIPTLDRYAFLRPLLSQLRAQTIAPLEILVVDQTPMARRDTDLEKDFSDLPLSVIRRDAAGQCSSRNAGLAIARGDFILFLDDDDEVPPDLIARHLSSLARFRAEASCGVADETGAGPLPEAFSLARVSDVFPTNNALIRREVLRGSGLFDLAYERGARADRDLGMRIYLSGALMVLHPDIPVVHHHAPAGGLRAHGARVITYASSTTRLSHRHLPSVTEVYLARRYFTPRQVRETLWRRAVGTLSIRGGPARKLAKLALGVVLLPDTLWRIHRREREASAMASRYPEIPSLPPAGEDAPAARPLPGPVSRGGREAR